MEQKLQDLLDKLYHEGVSKGQETADSIVQDAKRKASQIVREAETEAETIRSQARREAAEMKQNATSELKLSAGHAVSSLKQQIQQLIIRNAIREPLHEAFSDKDFLQNLIETLVRKWDPGQSGITLQLPEKEAEQLQHFLSHKLNKMLNGHLQINPSGNLENGFRIGPSQEGYSISFTEKDFETWFTDYLRPLTKELLFGKGE